MKLLIAVLFALIPTLGYSQTYNDDYAFITEVNRARILRGIPSLITNHDLQQSARVLGQNHIYFDCFESHKSCQGESSPKRNKRFYPGYLAVGEVWALGLEPRQIVDSFLTSPGHAQILLSSSIEIGGTLQDRQTAFGRFTEAIGEVGYRFLFPIGTPVISGAVYGGYAWMTYDAAVPPTAAFVSIGGQDFSLNLFEGTQSKGIYRVAVPTPSGCEKVTFNVRTDNEPIVYPSMDWDNYIGDLCAEAPALLDKVRITINSSGNRLFKGTLRFRLETLPNQNPQTLSITYGDASGVTLPAAPFLRHTSRATILTGTYRDNTLPAAMPGRVRVYLDHKLVASMYPTKVQTNMIGVTR